MYGKKCLVVIPAYNEAENIVRVIDELQRVEPGLDYVIVDDCSKDNTRAICESEGFNYIPVPVNLGIGGAVQTGYQYAVEHDYDIVVQMDGDGQHDPAFLEALIAPITAGEADMVVGSRFIEKKGFQTSLMRRTGISILRFVLKICCGARITDATSGLRATNKQLTRLYSKQYAQDYPEPEAIILAKRNGFKVKEVPVIMRERMEGVSSISAYRSAYYMIKVSLSIILCSFQNPKKREA